MMSNSWEKSPSINESDVLERDALFAVDCATLLSNFENKENKSAGEKLKFIGVNDADVYNISAPFNFAGKKLISGRIEKRNIIADSEVKFFKEVENGLWKLCEDSPTFKLEDGFVTQVEGELIFGGVEVYPTPTKTKPKAVGYRTSFYRGYNIASLEKFAQGPNKMKDLRMTELSNGHIGLFTRPQGGVYEGGRIGYVGLSSLEDITPFNIENAKIIENQFAKGEWGGVNELHLLSDGQIGVLGHIACYSKDMKKHYYAMSFIYDPATHTSTPIEIIATRKDFPHGPPKAPELEDIIFPGGLIRHPDGTATLYVGLSDSESGWIKIPDPFIGR